MKKAKAKIKKADNFAGYSEEFISFVIENRRKPSKTKKKRRQTFKNSRQWGNLSSAIAIYPFRFFN